MTSLSSLLTALTEDAILNVFLGLLKSAGFPVVSWDAKSIPRRLLRAFARSAASWTSVIPTLARSGFAKLAVGEWLSILAENLYDLERNPPLTTIGEIVLTDAGGVGPLTFGVGDLWAVAANGKRFRNTTGGTLTLSGTLTLEFTAEEAGEAWNVAPGDIEELGTPIAGVTIANPVIGSTGTWITRQGVDEEDDRALLQRMIDRWATLGVGGVEAAYDYWARTASTEVRRTKVLDAYPVAGEVTIYMAGPTAPVSGAAVTAVTDFFSSIVGHVLCVLVHALAATSHPITISGTVYAVAAKKDAARAGWIDALASYSSTLEIGGVVRVDKLIQLIMDQDGVIDITGLAPSANVTLAAAEVAVFTDSLVWSAV